uniref:Uncharacterized protein n=1 Tax=Chrysotila carterae TaxID=13221 RepID=A0A7S4B0N8_CHRCT|mmetsp:Transcript_127/g.225  ORF Transcript_127/g.225 Transcript_127/m.225 type:complete len:208 (+) Transcript_127:76-699(+)
MQGQSSRTWGVGSIVWRPGDVRAEVRSPRNHKPLRSVSVVQQTVSDSGKLHMTTTILTGLSEKTRISAMLQSLGAMMSPPLPPSRLRIFKAERELCAYMTLLEAGISADDVLRVRIARRNAAEAATQAAASELSAASAASTTRTSAKGLATATEAATCKEAAETGVVRSLQLRTMAGSICTLRGVHSAMDVSELRVLAKQQVGRVRE